MAGQAAQAAGPSGRGRFSLDFAGASQSVFACTGFIVLADLRPAARPVAVAGVPALAWQSAVGRRLLTAAEHAARGRYFERKAAAAMAKFRRARRGT